MNQKIGLLIFDFFLLFSILGFSQETPYWVSSRPINKDYYIGIGRCKLNVNNYEDIAKRKALDDLVSEISTTVKSDKLLTENEKYDNVKTDFTSTIQLSSDLEIEGYELLETWKDNEHYWVYYQLSKEKYITIVESKIKIDYSLAESLYNTSLKNLKDGNISFSIKQMYQSLEALKKNFSRQVDSEFKQKSFVLKDLICEQLVNIYHRLRIETNDTIETIYPITTPLVINCQILYFDANNQAQAVANIPLIFYFENGQGVLSDSVLLSNDSGFSKST